MEYIYAKSIVSSYKEENLWFGVNYNMNIYRGCSHGCIYCDSRSKCYNIDNFDKVRAKYDSTNIIIKELKSKKKTGVICTGAMSDPYNHFEEKYKLTREALKNINHYKYGICIMTKNNLVTRDIDILKQINTHSDAIVCMTITTFDDDLAKRIEPNAPKSSDRFKAIKELSDNGIYTGVLLMPILPFINDDEENIKNIVKKAHEVGAKFIYSFGFSVTLRDRQRDYYFQKLYENFKGDNLVELYSKTYKNEYNNISTNSKSLLEAFKRECIRYNILYDMKDIIKDYKGLKNIEQIKLF